MAAETGTVSVGGDRFAYLATGPETGPLVLCLHGFPDAPASFRPVLAALGRAGFRAVAPWMRGYAPSPLRGPHDPETLGADVIGLVRALSPGGRASVIGHDWGAVAAYAAAAAVPERLRCAVAMSVPHPAAFLANLARFPAQIARSGYMLAFQLPRIPELALASRELSLVWRLWRAWSPGIAIPAPLRDEIGGCLAASLPAPLGPYRALARRPRRALAWLSEARGLRVPTLQLHGDRDGCIAPALGAGQQALFAAPFERRLVEGAGHFLQVEAPAAVADHALAWLRAHDRREAA